MAQNTNYLVGFEIEIKNWEGKFKLSQDKNTEDFENAKAELIRVNQENIKTFLDRIF
jgi:transcriptional regulator